METPNTPATGERQKAPENEFRISERTNVTTAIKRMRDIYEKYDYFVISGINAGISRALLFVEIFRLSFQGFYQYNSIETITTEMKEENQEAGDEGRKRFLTRFKVEIFKNKPTNPKGFYQKPYTEEEVKKLKEFKGNDREGGEPGRGGFRGRGFRGRGFRGRFGNRGFRGRGDRGGRGSERGRGEDRGGRGSERGRGERGRGRGFGNRGFRGGRGEFRGRGFGNRGFRGGRGEGRGGQANGGSDDNYIPGLGKNRQPKTENKAPIKK